MQEIEEKAGTTGMATGLGMWMAVVCDCALVVVEGSERQPGGRYRLLWSLNWSLRERVA